MEGLGVLEGTVVRVALEAKEDGWRRGGESQMR